ncbi:unnamed protein product [Pieris macdunnoughi]|uniref:Transposable element P transposase-like GTP-binding insertion domain-containing protein n=1 Tax=Pieris macdunnoughi TaxID=345717 RepID=A0A821VIN5_9NEOP|nr:unnamed protein product [Pieris macdunnoughi]
MNKMRVKLATQLFSHSFAVAADHLTTRGDVPEECKNLIDITLLLDNIFDSLNVSSFHVPNGKKYKVRCVIVRDVSTDRRTRDEAGGRVMRCVVEAPAATTDSDPEEEARRA